MADAHYIEEAQTPLMEAEPSKKTGWATTLTLCAATLLASGAFLRSGAPQAASSSMELAAHGSKMSSSCAANDDVSIYKYTIASSKAAEDGEWADNLLGCKFRDVTDTHGCADLGKTSCLASTLAYNLHFVVNHVTPDSDSVATWDATMLAAHGGMQSFNAFMDYRLVFYTPTLDQLVANLLAAKTPFMMRQAPATVSDSSSSSEAGTTWYSLVVASPSGKVFEIASTQLNFKQLSATKAGKEWLRAQGGDVKEWSADENVCPHTQQQQSTSRSYTASELDAFHAQFADGDATKLLPIRNQIAVTSLAKAKQWWSTYVPSVSVEDLSGNSESCAAASFYLPAYTAKDFMVETRLVENSAGVRGSADVKAFVQYIEGVHEANTASNRGWDAWYDRHLGLLFDKCPLDDYMASFYQGSVSFNPHGRAETNGQGMATQHVWSEGVEGYGIEMQGFYDFSFRDCYSIFDWCTETTNGKQFCSADMAPAPTASPVEDNSASA